MNGIPKFDYGDVLIISYPFSDLRTFKKRPCVMLKELGEDVVVLFISSQIVKAGRDDLLVRKGEKNNLAVDSLMKVWKINTVHKSLIVGKLGMLDESDKKELKEKLIKNFNAL